MNKAFSEKDIFLYAVTDRKELDEETFYEKIEQALKGGVTILQLREKNIPFDFHLKLAVNVKKICDKYNVPLIINDNVDIAIKSGAAGVHVGLTDEPVSEIKKKAPGLIVGATAKTIEQARIAKESGADYIGVGAVFPSPTKTEAIRITNEKLREIVDSVNIPAVAIGGINLSNIFELKKSGLKGVAVVSAIFSAEDIEKTTKELKALVAQIIT